MLSNDFLRIVVVPSETDDTPAADVAPPLGDTPVMRLRSARTQFRKQVQALKTSMKALSNIVDDGLPVIEEHGWPVETADTVLDDIDEIRMMVRHWQMVASTYHQRSRQDLASARDHIAGEADGVDESSLDSEARL